MKRHPLEDRILDYLDGTMDAAERREMERALAQSDELTRLLEEYRDVCALETELRTEDHIPPANLEVKVMDRVEVLRSGSLWRFNMLPYMRGALAGAIATLATVVLVLKLGEENAGQQIMRTADPATLPPSAGSVEAHVDKAPSTTFFVPGAESGSNGKNASTGEVETPASPGKQGFLLEVDGASAIEGYAMPGARVDAVVTFRDPSDGLTKAQIVAENLPVLGAERGVAKADGTGRRTQQVRLDAGTGDVRKLEEARRKGPIALVLRGDGDSKGLGSADPSDLSADDRGVQLPRRQAISMLTVAPSNTGPTAGTTAQRDVQGSDSSYRSITVHDLIGRPATESESEGGRAIVKDQDGRTFEVTPGGRREQPRFVAAAQGKAEDSRALENHGALKTGDETQRVTRDRSAGAAGGGRVALRSSVNTPADGVAPLSNKPRAVESERRQPPAASMPINASTIAPYPPPGYTYDSRYGRWIPQPPSPPAPNEQYIATEENPRVRTIDEPMSTFGADVDTGSYTNVRRFLNTGQLPPRDAVRIEEMLNYFTYDYPESKDGPFAVNYEIAPSPLEPGRHLLRLAIKARNAGEATKPWNLVFLVDVSGSMAAANKLDLVKAGLRGLVGTMRASDRIAIVTYSGDSRIALDSSTVGDRTAILRVIDGLTAVGSTNGGAGIVQAYDVASRNFISGGVNRVVLATDGDFNVGVTSHDELMGMIEDRRRSGVLLTTLGVGTGDIKEGTLEQLADKGNGNYFYLDSVQEARRVLERELTGTIETVAKDVKLQVELNPRHVAEYRLIGYDNRRMANAQFHDDATDSGEIGAGHTVTALYEITLADSPLARDPGYRYREESREPVPQESGRFPDEIGFLKIRFKEPDASASRLVEIPLARSAVLGSADAASDDFRFAAAVSYFAHLLKKSRFAGSYTFREIADLAERSRGADRDGKRRELVELVKNAAVGH